MLNVENGIREKCKTTTTKKLGDWCDKQQKRKNFSFHFICPWDEINMKSDLVVLSLYMSLIFSP